MGQADVNVNLWLKDTKRFADLFNAILFHGETVILPENLHPSPETTAVSLQDAQGKNVVKKQYRDIIMNWQDQAVLMLLAVESQTAIHYAAPLKVMLYDSMEYAEQVRVKWKERPPRLSSAEFLSRFQKNDKLIPVLLFYNIFPLSVLKTDCGCLRAGVKVLRQDHGFKRMINSSR